MGIKGLNDFIKKTLTSKNIDRVNVFKKQKITILSGYRVAIDANLWAKTSMFSAIKDVMSEMDIVASVKQSTSRWDIINRKQVVQTWLNKMVNDINIFLHNKSIPIFVFDGEYPEEKTATKTNRKNENDKAMLRLDELRNKIFNGDPFDISPTDIEDITKLLCRMNYVKGEDYNHMKIVMYYSGVPYIQASCEGEKLCTALARYGIVKAVYSTDTDNIVYGCPLLITSFNHYNIETISLVDVLSILNISYNTFVDLCIMAQCDYNTNIPNLAIGKAYKLLKDHDNIDRLIELDLLKGQQQMLKHVRCRELFSIGDICDLVDEGKYDLDKDCIDINSIPFELNCDAMDRLNRTVEGFNTKIKNSRSFDPTLFV